MREAPATPPDDQGAVPGGFHSPMLLDMLFAHHHLCRVGARQAVLAPF